MAQVQSGAEPVERASLCAVLAPERAGSVAIVGNGPLSADDHRCSSREAGRDRRPITVTGRLQHTYVSMKLPDDQLSCFGPT